MNDNGKKLNEIKEQPDKKLKELSDDELEQVTGGGQCDNIQERLIKALKGG